MRIPRTAATTLAAVAATAVLAPASHADDCPNAEIRAKQDAAGLADCRAYEMVSPVDKGGVPLDARMTSMATSSGDAIAYTAAGGLPGGTASLFNTIYIGRRSGSGWSVDPVEAPQSNTFATLGRATRFLSDDLEQAMQLSTAALGPGAVDRQANLYRRDNLTGERTFIGTGAPLTGFAMKFSDPAFVPPLAATPDLSRFAFSAEARMLPEASANTEQAYEVVGDELRLLGRFPDGTPMTDAGWLSRVAGGPDRQSDSAISADGRRVFFGAGPVFPGFLSLYMRQDGTTTIPISASKRAGDPPDEALAATFGGASDNGSIVYFTSDLQLTDDPATGVGGLYRYDVESDALTNLTAGLASQSNPANVARVYEVSPDGSEAYLISGGAALAPDGVRDKWQIYHLDEAGFQLVAVLSDSFDFLPDNVAISENMRYFAFQSAFRPTGFDNDDPGCQRERDVGAIAPGTCNEVYVYDAVVNELTCATCVEAHVEAGGNRHSLLGPRYAMHSEYTPRAVLDDGTVYLTSAEALVAGDVNGKRDVYEWRDGDVRLVTTGRSTRDSAFADASPDGRDVFVFTAERLVASDTDGELDLYGVRGRWGDRRAERARCHACLRG